MKKKVFSIFLALMFTCLATIPAMASTEYIPCDSSPNGRHYMSGRGAGWVYIDDQEVLYGVASQCDHCNLVIISQYNPHIGATMLGDYGMWRPDYQVGWGVVMYTDRLYYNSNLSDEDFRGFDWS